MEQGCMGWGVWSHIGSGQCGRMGLGVHKGGGG